MREIKFRVWDRCNGRMVDPRNILKICMSRLNQEPYLIVYLRKWMNENREIKESDKCYTNEFELMQYTRLKDKNGIEIYEGDIIFWKDLSDSSDGTLEDAVMVFWDDENLRWSVETLGNVKAYEKLYDYSDSEEIEVIGNIYENKELLEGKKWV